MSEVDKLAQQRNVGPDPVEAQPNHVREKTYDVPAIPDAVEKEARKLPEATAEQKVREDMADAADKVKQRLP